MYSDFPNLTELIRTRRSVRTYDGRALTAADRQKLEAFATQPDNPFGVPVEIRLLDAKENGLSSAVLAGETLFAAGITPKVPYSDVAFGYVFEQFLLYAWSLGIGSVFIGGTMKRADFEAAFGLKDGERMPCISPLGYPAARRSVKEVMMRKGVKADDRKPRTQLFFDGAWDTPLPDAGDAAETAALEAVRLAPSAVNKQPWRVIRKDGAYHFYEKKDKGYVSDAVGDMQKVDIGIALAHFVLTLRDRGKEPTVTIGDPGLPVPPDAEYIASVALA